MGCISSKPSTHHQIIIPNHHLLTLVPPSNINHTIHESIPPKHDHDNDILTIHTNINLKVDDTLERCSSFHTVEEYDELLQRITKHNDDELAAVPVPDTIDSACKNDRTIETVDDKKQDMEFQTVASLRQWLHAPGGGGSRGEADVATTDYTTMKAGFSFYENNSKSTRGAEENSVLVKTGMQEEDESIVELVAAFDKYMQQLQIDEDNILKQIHNIIN